MLESLQQPSSKVGTCQSNRKVPLLLSSVLRRQHFLLLPPAEPPFRDRPDQEGAHQLPDKHYLVEQDSQITCSSQLLWIRGEIAEYPLLVGMVVEEIVTYGSSRPCP